MKEKAHFVFRRRHPVVKRREGLTEAVILRDAEFRAVPEPAKAMEQLDGERFAKLMAYLKASAARRVRTNNQVERTNWVFRFLEKARWE